MDIISVVLFCVAASITLKLLEKNGGEIKTVCSVAAACLVTLRFLDEFHTASAALEDLFEQTEMDGEYLTVIFKSLGICYVTSLGADCCRDCGENAMAGQLELVGKAAMLTVALPLFSAAAEIVKTLL